MLKQSLKILTAVICVIIMTAAFAGCGAATISKPSPSPEAVLQDVTGSCGIAVNGNIITVTGKTSFEAGTRINISVLGQDGMRLDSATVEQAEANAEISHDFTITDKYANITAVQGFITIAPTLYGKQPDSIFQKYGKRFENIKGNYEWSNDGITVMFASEGMLKIKG